MKDWTWNNKSVYTRHWASSHSEWERQEDDYYATDPNTINDLLKYIDIPTSDTVWENACWEWHLSKRLIELWYNVMSSDLVDRWYWESWIDFLKYEKTWLNVHIITNPPYKYAKEFAEKSIDCIQEWKYVCMFLKLTFLEGWKRYEFFKKHPPKKVLVFSKRQKCAKNGEFEKYESNAIAYAWYVWEKWYTWETIINWIL